MKSIDSQNLIKSETINNGITLTIITQNDVTVTDIFKDQFLASPQAIDLGITDIEFYYATTLNGWKLLLEDPSKSVDLAWGFNLDYFEKMEEWNLLQAIDNLTLADYIETKIPETFQGIENIHRNSTDYMLWFGTAFRTYGFILNHDFLEDYNLTIPSTWLELASPEYFLGITEESIALSDPPLSTTQNRINQIILQAYGDEEGWSILTRIGANGEIYYSMLDARAAAVYETAGIAPSYSGYGIIAHRENPDTEFVIPEDYTILDFCPISLGVNCDDQTAAEAFLQFIASPEGQALWVSPGIDEIPINAEVFQTPLGQTRSDIYELYNSTYDSNYFLFNSSLATENFDRDIYYFHHTIVTEHTLLQNTWELMITMLMNNTINSSYFTDLVIKLGAIPEDFECNTMWDPYPYLPCEEWQNFAKTKYNAIIEELTLFNNPITTKTDSLEIFLTFLFIFVFSAVASVSKTRQKK